MERPAGDRTAPGGSSLSRSLPWSRVIDPPRGEGDPLTADPSLIQPFSRRVAGELTGRQAGGGWLVAGGRVRRDHLRSSDLDEPYRPGGLGRVEPSETMP